MGFRNKDPLPLDRVYRATSKGKYSIRKGRFYTTPLEGAAQPQFPANGSAEKRSAMNMMAEAFRKPDDPDSDKSTSFRKGGSSFVAK